MVLEMRASDCQLAHNPPRFLPPQWEQERLQLEQSHADLLAKLQHAESMRLSYFSRCTRELRAFRMPDSIFPGAVKLLLHRRGAAPIPESWVSEAETLLLTSHHHHYTAGELATRSAGPTAEDLRAREAEVAELRRQLGERDSDLSRLHAQAQTEAASRQQLEQALQLKEQDAVASLARLAQEHQSQVAELSVSFARERQALQQALDDATRDNTAAAEAEAFAAELQGLRDTLARTTELFEAERRDHEHTVQTLNSELEHAAANTTALREQLSAANAAVAAAAAASESAQSSEQGDAAKARAEAEQLRALIEEEKRRFSLVSTELEKERAKAARQRELHEQEFTRLQREFDKMKEERAQNRGRLDELIEKNAQKEQSHSEDLLAYEDEMAKLRQQNKQLLTAVDDQRARYLALQRDLAAAKKDLDEVRAWVSICANAGSHAVFRCPLRVHPPA